MLDTPRTGVNLYVTFVEKEGPFLKIWGQTDKNNSVYVEQFLLGTSPQFDLGVAKVLPEQVQLNTLVCAKYKDTKYYRARVLNNSFLHEGFIEVCFLDYGNKDVVPIENIRSLQSFPTSFISIPPLATGFIFAEAHCVGGGEWNDTIFESIVKEIKYREVHCQLLSPATQYYLIKIFIDNTDLCNVLIQRGLMQPISLQAQQAVLLSMSMQRQSQSSNVALMSPPSTLASGGLNTYKASSLEPGCLYPVYVSYVNDGPCHFSVQLKNSEEVLVKLMNEINSINLRLLEDVPMPGTICLARCQEDGNICRAVVTNEVDNQFKVFYVDFGNYEVVPLESLFQIPFKYVLPKVMAIRLCLGGVEKSTVTIEMQKAFKQFVDNRLLHMKVIPNPQRMAIPKCELWDPESKTSALDVVNRAARHAYPEPISLNRGFSQLVKVSFVYSCKRFYVQLSSKESELTSLMTDLQEICQSTDVMDSGSLKAGLPCCALFETDGQWYRSQVCEVLGDNVIVRYIDYGNEEAVAIMQLKNIDGEQLTVLRPQAIECCLNGYQNMNDDPERDLLLEELILEGEFTMKVVDMLDKKALVELYDPTNSNVASLLLDRLAIAKSQVSPALVVQAGNKIEHKKSYAQQNGPSRVGDGQMFRYDRQDRTDRLDRNDRQGRSDRDRGERQGRERRDFNKTQNENWRQDTNKDFRKYDRNSNENGQDSWRQNNKGFSPKHQNNFTKASETDSWKTNNTSPKNNDNWNPKPSTNQNNSNEWADTTNANAWNDTETPSQAVSSYENDWNTPNDRGNSFQDRNRAGGRFNNDRGDRGGRGGSRGERFDAKSKDRDGGFRNKSDTRSENSFDGSEKRFYYKGPRTSSRNEPGNRFQKNFDKHGGNNTLQNADSWNDSEVIPPIDPAPVTASYGSCRVVGTEASVTVSWFHNPSHFYLQLVDSQNEFKRLVEDIQQFYKSRKPETVGTVGTPIIGLFPEDNVLYRAQILEILGTQYKVYYIDFGNVSTITKIWPIDKKFMNLPAQAIVCSLRDVAPPGEAGTWPDADSYSNYFDKDSFLCRFIDEDENKTYVNLFHNSDDIGEILARDGVAVSTKSSIPPVEISLLLGQQFRATVKSVNNLGDIILGLECGSVVCCAMHNLETSVETHENTLKSMLEQTVIVYVDNVIDDKLEITLYDTEGNKLVLVDPDDGAFDVVEPLCPILVLQSIIVGYVYFADETFVYIQPSEYADQIMSLSQRLSEFYLAKEKEDTNIIPEEEQIYAVRNEDDNWYRGKVISFDDETVTVLYIDYGITESVKFESLSELAPQFKEMCSLCLKVDIGAEAAPYNGKMVTAKIFYGDEGWEGTVYVWEQPAASSSVVPTVSISSSSNEYVQNVELSEESEDEDNEIVPIVEQLAAENIHIEEGVHYQNGTLVFMSHIDSPNEFYLQLYESVNNVEELQATLQQKIPELAILETPSAGMLCAAPYSLDQEWYRAEILDADDDITTVRFIDFGNTDVIDNKMTQIKTLPHELLSLAVYATKCSLLVKPVEEEWSSAAIELFETLTAESLTADFLNQDGKLNYVELYCEDRKVSDILIEQGYANATEAKEKDINKGKLTGFVSHLNSPSEFWIQLENCIDDLEWIVEQLSTAENFLELEDLTPGTLCAALFPDDQMWYRARILSNTVAGIELLFIDYGNSCTGSSLRQLPEDLVIIQPLAMKCSLQKPEGTATWSEEASSKFCELSAEGQTIFTLKKLSTGETSVVQLLLNEEDIIPKLMDNSLEGYLAPSTEEGYVTEDENLENLTIEVAGEPKSDKYKLEPVGEKPWEKPATEKFKEINQEGTTLYQIEFLDNKTVRLYLEGKDIRPLLSPYRNSKHIVDELENEVFDETIENGETEQIHISCSTPIKNSSRSHGTTKEEKQYLEQKSVSEEEVSIQDLSVKGSTKIQKDLEDLKIEKKTKHTDPTYKQQIDTIIIESKNVVLEPSDLNSTASQPLSVNHSSIKMATEQTESLINPNKIESLNAIETALGKSEQEANDGIESDIRYKPVEMTQSGVSEKNESQLVSSKVSSKELILEQLEVKEQPDVPTNTPVESPKKDGIQKINAQVKITDLAKLHDKIMGSVDKKNSSQSTLTIAEDCRSKKNDAELLIEKSKIGSDVKTNDLDNASPHVSNMNSPLGSRETSRPSSRNMRKFSHDEKVLPGYLSRPETPLSGDDEPNESSDVEIKLLLENVIDRVTEPKEDVQTHSRPHSRMNNDERILPGVVSRPASLNSNKE